ncbi:MAG: cell wall-active antibiotics response protein LiaF [Chloroflexota bacterium]
MKRINSGEAFFALALILIGALLLAGNLGWLAFNWNIVWPLVLILFGAWLIWRAFQPARYSGGAAYGFGDYQPDLTGKAIRDENFSHGLGEFDLDLSRATIPDGASAVRASLGFGDLKVIVPRDLAVRVKARAGLGDVAVFGQKDEGIAPAVDFQSDDYATAPRKLDLEASVGLGEVKVVRAS